MTKKHLEECRAGKDFVDYAKVHGGTVTYGKGDHMHVHTGKGMCVVPVAHELGKGLRHVIIKTFMAIGITAVIYFLVVILPHMGVS